MKKFLALIWQDIKGPILRATQVLVLWVIPTIVYVFAVLGYAWAVFAWVVAACLMLLGVIGLVVYLAYRYLRDKWREAHE